VADLSAKGLAPYWKQRAKAAENREAFERNRAVKAEVEMTHMAIREATLRSALTRLEFAERNYRKTHDVHGDGSREAGRAWDELRRAGNEARQALKEAAQPEPLLDESGFSAGASVAMMRDVSKCGSKTCPMKETGDE